MPKVAILFGAGASVDAGLPDTFKLTETVYERLKRRHPDGAKLFAFVVAKLIVRNTRRGASPFEKINVEEAYDALKRLLSRNSDLLGQFVSSWEPLTSDFTEPDIRKIKGDLSNCIRIVETGRRPLIDLDDRYLRRVVDEINRTSKDFTNNPAVLSHAVDILAESLSTDRNRIKYLSDFVKLVSDDIECVATLNYDTTFEDACDEVGLAVDDGLESWNSDRTVRFTPNSIKLYKLHGSVGWYKSQDDDIVKDIVEVKSYRKERAMIFGGQGEKLNPNGPFITLRQEFQRSLFKCTTLAIIGYSLGDDHLNAILRMWIASKRRGKLIVLNPAGIGPLSSLAGNRAAWTGQELISDSVEFCEIKGGFAEHIKTLTNEIKSAPRPKGKPKTPSLRSKIGSARP